MRGCRGRAVLVVLLLAMIPTAAGAQQPPPQPTISVKPNCSNSTTRWSFTVSGTMPVQTIVTVFFDGEEVGSGFSEGFTYSVNVSVPAEAPGTYVVGARHERDPRGSLVQTTFTSPCPSDTTTSTTTSTTSTTSTTTPPDDPPPATLNPVLVFAPAVGPEGSATTLFGTGWPPGAAVAIAGNVVVSDAPVADAAGNFAVAAVLLPNSGLGERVLTGSAPGANAAAAFLVVPSTMQPPRFLFR